MFALADLPKLAGFIRSPFGDGGYKWSDGTTAIYVEPHTSGTYSVTVYRPYGHQIMRRHGLTAGAAASVAVDESRKA